MKRKTIILFTFLPMLLFVTAVLTILRVRATPATPIIGDCNADGLLNRDDIRATTDAIFAATITTATCDANGDSSIDSADLVCLEALIAGESCHTSIPLGTNLDKVIDYSSELVFADLLKQRSSWVPHDANYTSYISDTHLLDLTLDQDGWITSLPPVTSTTATYRMAAAYFLTNGNTQYPSGIYRFYHEGKGKVSFGGSAKLVQYWDNNRPYHEVSITAGTNTAVIYITAVDPSDPLRNLQLFMPGIIPTTVVSTVTKTLPFETISTTTTITTSTMTTDPITTTAVVTASSSIFSSTPFSTTTLGPITTLARSRSAVTHPITTTTTTVATIATLTETETMTDTERSILTTTIPIIVSPTISITLPTTPTLVSATVTTTINTTSTQSITITTIITTNIVITEMREVTSTHTTYVGPLFNPDFINSVEPYEVLRFMDWMRTNWADENNRVRNAPKEPLSRWVQQETAEESQERSESGSLPRIQTPFASLDWEARPLPSNSHYSTDQGVPIEIMVALINETEASPWFNIPHQADDTYVENFAALVLSEMGPTKTVYLEYSNEIWNTAFAQGCWMEANGLEATGVISSGQIQATYSGCITNQDLGISNGTRQTARYTWYGLRTNEICEIWQTVWGDQAGRIVCVAGLQASNDARGWLLDRVFDCNFQHKNCQNSAIDAVAIAPYFGAELGDPLFEKIVSQWTTDDLFSHLITKGNLDVRVNYVQTVQEAPAPISATGTISQFVDVQQSMRTNLLETITKTHVITYGSPTLHTIFETREIKSISSSFDWAIGNMETYKIEADLRNIKLMAYEGGQHLSGYGRSRENADITELFIAANRDPRMGALYIDYLTAWCNTGGSTFNHFMNTSPASKFGSWGAQEHLNDTGAAKFDALVNFTTMYEKGIGCTLPATTTTQLAMNSPITTVPVLSGMQQISITLDSNGHPINAASFALRYDTNQIAFDDTDSDGDGSPDAFIWNLPTGYTKTVSHDSSGTIQVAFYSSHETKPITHTTVVTVAFDLLLGGGAGVTFESDASNRSATCGDSATLTVNCVATGSAFEGVVTGIGQLSAEVNRPIDRTLLLILLTLTVVGLTIVVWQISLPKIRK